jgi:hypothetical protein
VTVDVVNGTGDQAVADTAAARLTGAGLTVATVTGSPEAPSSAIEFPAGAEQQARALAEALGVADLLRPGGGAEVTVVLGSADAARLVEALDRFTGLPCPAGG